MNIHNERKMSTPLVEKPTASMRNSSKCGDKDFSSDSFIPNIQTIQMGSVYNTDSFFTTVTEFIRKQTGSNRRISTRRSGDLYYTIFHTHGQYDDEVGVDDDDDDDDDLIILSTNCARTAQFF